MSGSGIRRRLRRGDLLACTMMIAGGLAASSPADEPPASATPPTLADIPAIEDPLERADRRLAAAAAILRTEIPPRVRTRLLWTPFSPAILRNVEATLGRARELVDEAAADLASLTGARRDRRVARAVCLTATLDLLETMNRRDRPRVDSETLRAIHRGLGDAVERTTEIDGPTLTGLAMMALVAGESASTRSAATLLTRIRENPAGVDALEFEWLERLVGSGSAKAENRLGVARGLLRARRRPADRLLLAAIMLQAASETMSIDDAVRATVVELLRTTEEDPAIRPKLVRGLADVASELGRGADPAETPPLVALGRAIESSAAGDVESATGFARRGLDAGIDDIVVEARLELANQALGQRRTSEAIEQLVAACETLPSHPSALRGAALAARLADTDPDDRLHAITIRRLASALPRHPGIDDWMMRCGSRAMLRGDESAAREAWTSIDRRAERGPEALVRICELQDPGVEPEVLLRRLDAVESRLPVDPIDPLRIAADLVRIELLLGLDRVTSAAKIAARWTSSEPLPVDVPTRLRLARLAIEALGRDGRGPDAARLLERLESEDPTLARRLLANGRREAHLTVVERLDADDRRAAGETAEGMLAVAARTKTEEDPRRPDLDEATLLEWAWIDAAAGRADRSAERLRRILETNPDAAGPLTLRAILLGGRLATPPDAKREPPSVPDATEALGILARIVRGTTPADPVWWRCEIERLELLHLLGRNLDRIGPRIDRLRAERPDFGSEGFRRRFERLRGLLPPAGR